MRNLNNAKVPWARCYWLLLHLFFATFQSLFFQQMSMFFDSFFLLVVFEAEVSESIVDSHRVIDKLV